jgi:hypothetical protein
MATETVTMDVDACALTATRFNLAELWVSVERTRNRGAELR